MMSFLGGFASIITTLAVGLMTAASAIAQDISPIPISRLFSARISIERIAILLGFLVPFTFTIHSIIRPPGRGPLDCLLPRWCFPNRRFSFRALIPFLGPIPVDMAQRCHRRVLATEYQRFDDLYEMTNGIHEQLLCQRGDNARDQEIRDNERIIDANRYLEIADNLRVFHNILRLTDAPLAQHLALALGCRKPDPRGGWEMETC